MMVVMGGSSSRAAKWRGRPPVAGGKRTLSSGERAEDHRDDGDVDEAGEKKQHLPVRAG
jgi:hypothetical protein